jgi:predicted RNA binding protein YcfA (HicA-like mRNA interferase family)
LKQVSGKELAQAVQRKGWLLARIKGSYHVFIKQGRHERIVIPIHGNRPLKIGLLRSQMKIADLLEDDIRYVSLMTGCLKG